MIPPISNSFLFVPSVLPALLDRLFDAFRVLFSVVFIEVRCFDVGRRACVGIVQKTIHVRIVGGLENIAHLWILVNTAATSYVGLHLFCRISKHSSPVAYTLGWNIWLMNLTAGGLFGYCSSNCITRRNVPSSKGVSAGPIITAFLGKVSMLSSLFWSEHIPLHNIICHWRSRYACRRVCLHALVAGLVMLKMCSIRATHLKVSHQAATSCCRHAGYWAREEVSRSESD